MREFLKLIRVPNLLFIVLTQWIMRQVVIVPVLQLFGFELTDTTLFLWMLIFATVCIAAGGYVLNDYFDIKIDSINRPDAVIVGKTISKRAAMRIYQVFTASGLITGLVLSFSVQSFTLACIFIITTGLLWFYSASYKRQFLTGNLVVSFLAAMSVLIVSISEVALLKKSYGALIYQTPIPSHIYLWVGGFAFFAFLCTLIREIIKDMEDMDGDRELESRTMPIIWGCARTKYVVYSLIVLTVGLLYTAACVSPDINSGLTLRYIHFGITLPFIILIYLVATSKSTSDYHQASVLTKFIMVIGVLYSFLFYFQLAKTTGLSLFNIFVIK